MEKSKQFCEFAKRFLVLLFLLIGGFMYGQTPDEIGIDNDTLHLKLDLTRGGAIFYISESGTTRNIVNIHDEGRYIQQSYYAGKPINRQAEGQSPSWSPWAWNPIQVGDAYNNRAEILDYSENGNTLYVKCIPMLWDMNNMPAEAEMEQWTTLNGNVLKVRNKLTCLRTDDIYEEYILNHQELPAVYPISALENLYGYFGSTPFTGGAIDNPVTEHLEDGFWGFYSDDMVTENWMAYVDDNQWGIAVYNPLCTNFLAGMAGEPGGEEFDGSTSYISPVKKEILNKNSVYEYEYYLVVGTLDKIRSDIYDIKGVQKYSWDFTYNLENWDLSPAGGTVINSDGNLKFTVQGDDPHVYNNVSPWLVGDAKYLWLSVKNETIGVAGEMYLFPHDLDSIAVSFTQIPNDTEYRDIMVDMTGIDVWTEDLVVDSFRLDPINTGETGDIYFGFIRFENSLIDVSSEGNVQEIVGLNNSLQLYAKLLPLMEVIDVEWSVDKTSFATIDEVGMLTAVSEGVVIVTATAKDGSGIMASIQITIIDDSQQNSWEFDEDLEGWDVNPHSGVVEYFNGSLKFTVTGDDPYVSNNVAPWTVGDLNYLWLSVKNETAGNAGALYIFPQSGAFDLVSIPLTPNDNEFRNIFIDMTQSDIWRSGLSVGSLRLDPINSGDPGDVYLDFMRFMENLVTVSAEGDATEIIGAGNSLQMYAEVIAPGVANEVDWAVGNERIATIDQTGLLTSILNGVVLVTATAKDNPGVGGTIKITIVDDNTSVQNIDSQRLFLHPNPVSNILNISNTSEISRVTFFNFTGQIVKEVSNTSSDMSISIESLAPGLYFIRARYTKGDTTLLRFIKK